MDISCVLAELNGIAAIHQTARSRDGKVEIRGDLET
jgi:hypothetical protein